MTDDPSRSPSAGPWIIWGSVVALAILHQDFWLWDDGSLLFGFLPIGLAYHAGFSIVAASIWALSTRLIWPHHLEAWADEGAAAKGTERER